MSDLSVSWITPCRSAWRERLRCAAQVLTTGVATGLAFVLLFDSELLAMAGAGGAALLAAIRCRTAGRLPVRWSWRVTASGRILVRCNGAEPAIEAKPAFHSSFLIVLRQGQRTLDIWRDAAPAAAFRRLSVAVRWNTTRNTAFAAGDRLNAPDRT